MFKRSHTRSIQFGLVYHHTTTTKRFKISSDRRSLELEGKLEISSEDQLSQVIRELRVAWFEHVTLKDGKIPNKEQHNVDSATITRDGSFSSRSRSSR